MRRLLLAVLAAALLASPAHAATRPVGAKPLSDRAAAQKVKHSSWEPRPENADENRRTLTNAQLRTFRRKSDMPYKARVSGRFKGTTDETIQWAAYKHGIDVNVMRAVAVVESWWRMSTVGDDGDSFGLYQLRRPFHCCPAYAKRSTAFNADYYGAIIRAYYDGRMPWLNDVERGTDYRPGDLYGSLGAWFAGRWHTPPANEYIQRVKDTLKARTWKRRDFQAATD